MSEPVRGPIAEGATIENEDTSELDQFRRLIDESTVETDIPAWLRPDDEEDEDDELDVLRPTG